MTESQPSADVSDRDPSIKLYGVSTGNGNDGISHMYPDYYVWTNDPWRLAQAAMVDQFKADAGMAWAMEHIDVDGEAEYTIHASLDCPPSEDTADGEYPTLYRLIEADGEESTSTYTEDEKAEIIDKDAGRSEDDFVELEYDEYEDGRNWSESNGAWMLLDVFPVDESEAREGKPIYDSIADALSETVLELVPAEKATI